MGSHPPCGKVCIYSGVFPQHTLSINLCICVCSTIVKNLLCMLEIKKSINQSIKTHIKMK